MGIRINENIFSLFVRRNLTRTSDKLDKAFNRLASGEKINSSGDDPAGLANSHVLRQPAVEVMLDHLGHLRPHVGGTPQVQIGDAKAEMQWPQTGIVVRPALEELLDDGGLGLAPPSWR